MDQVVAPPTGRLSRAEPRRLAQLAELVGHLARRELISAHRFTALGWTWPLARQLVQLGVLAFLFSGVLDLNIPNYAAFIFVGLIVWSWFAGGIAAAAVALPARRHLVFQARMPDIVLPVVAIAVPLVDVLFALPVLLGILAIGGGLRATIVLLPLLLAVQALLMCGIGWLVAAGTAFLRDVPAIVGVALTVLFYLTPVFYESRAVPDRYLWVLRVNPMSTLVEADRALAMGTPFPPAAVLAAVVAASVALAVAGAAAFTALAPRFVDEL